MIPRKAQFTIPGSPVGKARPRFTRGRTYTPAKSKEYEEVVAYAAHQAIKQPFTGPVRLTLLCWFEIPQSLSAPKRQDRLSHHHTQKPDLDNVVKAITDGMNGIAYADDSQIAEVRAVKIWGHIGKVEAFIEEMSA